MLSESPRRVEVSRAAELTPLTGRALAVAVVTTEDAEWIAAALAEGGFGAVQLCAGADGPTVADMRAAARERALRPLVIAAQDIADARSADLLLLDARTTEAYGGTGRTLDWPALAAQHLPRERLVLAGGLRRGRRPGERRERRHSRRLTRSAATRGEAARPQSRFSLRRLRRRAGK